MKKSLIGIVLFTVLLVASISHGGASINGFWHQPDESDSLILFSQEGKNIHVLGTYAINGQPRVWHGSGQRYGDTISYTYTITLGPAQALAAGRNTGKHTLTISPDGRAMTGSGVASDGTSSAMALKKKTN